MVVDRSSADPLSLLIALAPEPASPVPFLIASGFLVSFDVVVYNINQVSFRQAITPERDAGPDERDDAVHRLGHDPDRQIVGGILALDDRPARGALGRAAIWRSCFAFVPVAPGPVALRELPAGDGLAERLEPSTAQPVARVDRGRVSRRSSIGTWTPRSRATSIARS